MVKLKDNHKNTNRAEFTVCRCEEVHREEIIAAIRSGARSIAAIGRRISAGMGLCQGKTCQRLIAQILREEGIPLEDTCPRTIRPPVRPVPVHLFEDEAKQE